jgi:hypothetical protein
MTCLVRIMPRAERDLGDLYLTVHADVHYAAPESRQRSSQ